jgi:6-phosphofructokinase
MSQQHQQQPSARILVAQGGGPTAVINQSLVGIVLQAQALAGGATVYGARHGVRGIVGEDFVDLSHETRASLEAVAATPAAALGSTRDKPDACGRIASATSSTSAATTRRTPCGSLPSTPKTPVMR